MLSLDPQTPRKMLVFVPRDLLSSDRWSLRRLPQVSTRSWSLGTLTAWAGACGATPAADVGRASRRRKALFPL